ncbi:MAG TPA: FAD-dependent monooxygenase [Bryobacteraceae bacterium]|jgi:flavin-dependent dehydrogenase|nr:FAD-dependent monooxygenase [Bryobacteraceae bacterium]
MVKTDVAIAGGGPAGLAAAIAARRKGLSVAVFEGVAPTKAIDKCCGEGLMPDALEALGALGVKLPKSARMPVLGVRFIECGHAAEARFNGPIGAGVRRTTLSSVLLEHARDAGAEIFFGQPVRGLARGGILAGDEEVQCRWIVGADGSQSGMRRIARLESRFSCPRRFGLRRHFRTEPWSDLVEAYWAHGVQAFVTPVAENEVGVAVLSSNPRLRYQAALELFPELLMRLEGAAAVSNVRGAVTASRRLDQVATRDLALLGDASGSVDSVTGLGLCMSFQQAVALGEALAKEDLALYETQHHRLAKRPRVMESVMLAMDQRDKLRRRAIRTLEAEPAHFSSLLSVHTGTSSALSFALRAPLALGWRFLMV